MSVRASAPPNARLCDVKWLARDCRAASVAVRSRIGYLPGELGFYRDMSGQDTLDLLAGLTGRPAVPATRRDLLRHRTNPYQIEPCRR